MNNSKRKSVFILAIFSWSLLHIVILKGQMLISEKSDLSGNYARIGQPISIASYIQTRLGDDKIETHLGGIFNSTTNRRLVLTAGNSDINIGTAISLYNSTLAITAPDNALDLHLQTHGRIFSSGGFNLHLDEDGGSFASFIVKGSDFLDNRFGIHEIGDHFVKGDLVVDGSVISNSSNTFHKVLQNVDFEISGDPGDEIDFGYSTIRADGDGSLTPSHQQLKAAFNLPKGSELKEISFEYIDNNPNNHLLFRLVLCAGTDLERRITIPHGNPDNFSSPTPKQITIPLNESTDQQCVNYFSISDHYEPVWFGNHWDGMAVHPVRLKYTAP